MIHYIEECDDRFYLKESTIPGAGRGVFANKTINKGDYLRVVGVVIKKDSTAGNLLRKQPIFFKYIFQNPQIQGWLIPLGYGGMVNHTDNSEEKNCDIVCIGGDVFYKFNRKIEKDQEVLGYYGFDWNGWDANI